MIDVFVKAITWESEGVLSFDLRHPQGSALPAFTPGAHIDVEVDEGQSRSYSLVNPDASDSRYLIAVHKDAAGRGGSVRMHERVRVGQTLRISAPKNHFVLSATGGRSVLLAGGIGITPLLSMAQRLSAEGRAWALHYGARTRKSAAFVAEIRALAARTGSEANFYFEEDGGARMALPDLVARSGPEDHFYCCGPAPMLDAFEQCTNHLPEDRVHLERFAAAQVSVPAGGFRVSLARSGKSLIVQPGESILDALRGAGVCVPSSCMQGVCGTCEVGVLEGIPDHRDVLLSKSDRAANRTMMICCSGSKTAQLVLDL